MAETPRVFGALLGEQTVHTTSQLALYLGGSEDSFTGQLLYLIAKGAHSTYGRFARGFPDEVRAYQVWMAASSTPTAAQLYEAITADRAARPADLMMALPAAPWTPVTQS